METTKVTTNKRSAVASKPEVPSGRDRADRIAHRAYELWQARGCPSGDDRSDWLQAERELTGDAAPDEHS